MWEVLDRKKCACQPNPRTQASRRRQSGICTSGSPGLQCCTWSSSFPTDGSYAEANQRGRSSTRTLQQVRGDSYVAILGGWQPMSQIVRPAVFTFRYPPDIGSTNTRDQKECCTQGVATAKLKRPLLEPNAPAGVVDLSIKV